MADPVSAVDALLPDFKAAAYALLAFIGAEAFARYRGRRAGLYWTATFQRVVPQPDDPVAPRLSVTLNGQPCVNLQACHISLRNESSTDVDELDLLVAFEEPFLIVEAFAALDSSAKRLLSSEQFNKTRQFVESLPPPDKANNPSGRYLLTSREYHLPALNRGETATLKFWVHSPVSQAAPVVRVSSEKAGVKIVSRPANYRALDIGELKKAIPLGLVVSLLLAYGSTFVTQTAELVAIASCISGVACGIFGLLALQMARHLKRLV